MSDRMPAPDCTTYLYRHFDAEGNLLYVGISLSAVTRLRQHQDNAHWFNDIRRVEIERFGTRSEASTAEALAVANEKPKHNVRLQHNQRYTEVNQLGETRARVEQTLYDLESRIVRYRPLYRLTDAAHEIGVSRPFFVSYLNLVGIEPIVIGKYTYVTGWQLLDFLDCMESMGGSLATMRNNIMCGNAS